MKKLFQWVFAATFVSRCLEKKPPLRGGFQKESCRSSLFHRAGGNLVAVLVEGVVLVHHAAIVARTLLLLRDRPYFIRLDDTDVVEQPVVLVVVGNDDAAFLFLRQHELYIILNGFCLIFRGQR